MAKFVLKTMERKTTVSREEVRAAVEAVYGERKTKSDGSSLAVRPKINKKKKTLAAV